MIKTFRHKELKNYWTKNDSSRISSEMVTKIRLLLDLLNDVEQVPQDFEPFRNLRIHLLKGDLKDFGSLDVTSNHRLIFKFENKNVFDIDLLDTH